MLDAPSIQDLPIKPIDMMQDLWESLTFQGW